MHVHRIKMNSITVLEPPQKRARQAEAEAENESLLSNPIMLLTGHDAPVYTCAFDPTGKLLASGSHDKQIFLWEVREDCANVNVLKGHKNAVIDLCWTASGDRIVTASADKTVSLWEPCPGRRVRKMEGHTKVVNSVSVNGKTILSGSDDARSLLWDARSRRPQSVFESRFAVTAVSFDKTGEFAFTAGLDGAISTWDLRKNEVVYTLEGHRDTITSLKLSPDGVSLLSNSMDKSLIQWDIRPFATNRLRQPFTGAQHNMERNLLKCDWSADSEMVSCGSSDHVVHIWDVPSGEELYHLPGHAGSVNQVAFHPAAKIIASCGSDKQIFLGEL